LLSLCMIKRHHANDNPFLIVSPRWIQFTVSLEDTYANQIYQLLAECEDLNAALPDAKKNDWTALHDRTVWPPFNKTLWVLMN
jgi:hypothetical protein